MADRVFVEPEMPETVNVTVCFEATVNYPLNRQAEFQQVLNTTASNSTASEGTDYYATFDMRPIVIEPDFVGMFETCRTIMLTILGDDVVEDNQEFIVIQYVPLDGFDYVVYPGNGTALNITIYDDDCESLTAQT